MLLNVRAQCTICAAALFSCGVSNVPKRHEVPLREIFTFSYADCRAAESLNVSSIVFQQRLVNLASNKTPSFFGCRWWNQRVTEVSVFTIKLPTACQELFSLVVKRAYALGEMNEFAAQRGEFVLTIGGPLQKTPDERAADAETHHHEFVVTRTEWAWHSGFTNIKTVSIDELGLSLLELLLTEFFMRHR
jgi:hypothetical protein